MNSKIVISFMAGALIASGIVYIAVKEDAQPKVAAVPATVPVPAAPKTPPPRFRRLKQPQRFLFRRR